MSVLVNTAPKKEEYFQTRSFALSGYLCVKKRCTDKFCVRIHKIPFNRKCKFGQKCRNIYCKFSHPVIFCGSARISTSFSEKCDSANCYNSIGKVMFLGIMSRSINPKTGRMTFEAYKPGGN